MLNAFDLILGGFWGKKYGVIRRYWSTFTRKDHRIFSEPSHKRWKSPDFDWKNLGPQEQVENRHEDGAEYVWVIWCEKIDTYPSEVYRVAVQEQEPLFMRNSLDEIVLM